MTLWNYDNEVMSCRGEAAGPMARRLIQKIRAWACSGSLAIVEFGAAEAHARRGHQMSNRRSEARIGCTAEPLLHRLQQHRGASLWYPCLWSWTGRKTVG